MAFGARPDENEEKTVWRICRRRGETVRRLTTASEVIWIKFDSQSKAKACAEELNTRWKEIDAVSQKEAEPSDELLGFVIDTIKKHT